MAEPELSREQLQEKLSKLRIIHEATNQAVGELHNKLDEAALRNATLENQLSNANQNLEQQKVIVRTTIEQAAETERGLTEEITRLKGKLREAGIVDRG